MERRAMTEEATDLRNRLEALKREVSDRTQRWAVDTKEWARENPMATIGIVAGVAIGVGLVVGLMIGRGSRD